MTPATWFRCAHLPLLAFILLLCATPLGAQPTNCSTDRTKSGALICSDPQLQVMDREADAAYLAILPDTAGDARRDLLLKRLAWRKAIDRCADFRERQVARQCAYRAFNEWQTALEALQPTAAAPPILAPSTTSPTPAIEPPEHGFDDGTNKENDTSLIDSGAAKPAAQGAPQEPKIAGATASEDSSTSQESEQPTTVGTPEGEQPLNRVILALIVVAFLVIVGSLYFAPTIVAFRRRHRNRWIILWLNLAIGITLLGWFAVLLWAMNKADVGEN